MFRTSVSCAGHLVFLVQISSSLCNLGVLCVSVVVGMYDTKTTEAQRTQRLHREDDFSLMRSFIIMVDYNLTLIKPLVGIGASKASGVPDEKERRSVDMKLLVLKSDRKST